MKKLCTVGAVLCGAAAIVSAIHDNSLSFLLFLFFTAAFLFLLTDN